MPENKIKAKRQTNWKTGGRNGWACGRVGVWACGRLGVWAFGRLGVCGQQPFWLPLRVTVHPFDEIPFGRHSFLQASAGQG
jgi:hypothetical protein